MDLVPVPEIIKITSYDLSKDLGRILKNTLKMFAKVYFSRIFLKHIFETHFSSNMF